ncbi:ParB N-terminal domain-containing protein [Microcoleus sp. B7-D4]|uniref:ParB N-terminal domain-containing protein n=1 Tax=Microcoleus sp. B7-D4 TaxID=2818696 RepID=UPI002FD73A1B
MVAGKHRYKVPKAAGLMEVPVVIRERSDAEAMHYALMENLQREDVNVIEETEEILQLLEMSLQTDPEPVLSLLNRVANKTRGLTDNVISNEDGQAI